MRRPNFSIGSWAFSFGPFKNNPWSFQEFMRYAADAGYDGIEINGFHPHPRPDVYNFPEKCQELYRAIAGHFRLIDSDGTLYDFCFCLTTEVDGKKTLPFVENVINQIV